MKAAEQLRPEEARTRKAPWKQRGPYLSERQWATAGDDTSDDGDAWNSFPRDHARSRAYRWGEDGSAGIPDDSQRLYATPNASPFVKEGIQEFPVHGQQKGVNPAREGTKVAAHYLRIGSGMIRPCDEGGMWDDPDGFFHDVLRSPVGRSERLKVRSMVGLLPLCAVTIFEGRIPMGGSTRCFTSTYAGTPGRASRPAIRPAGPVRSRITQLFATLDSRTLVDRKRDASVAATSPFAASDGRVIRKTHKP